MTPSSAVRCTPAWGPLTGWFLLLGTLLFPATADAQYEARLVTPSLLDAESGQAIDKIRILVTENGKPLAGRQVVLELRTPVDPPLRIRLTGNQATTDSSGAVELRQMVLVVSGRTTVDLVPKVDGLIPRNPPALRVQLRARVPSSVLVTPPSGGFLIGARSEVPLTVGVGDDRGTPFAGADVAIRANRACGPLTGLRATTGTDGRAAFPDLAFPQPENAAQCSVVAEAEFAGTEPIRSEEVAIRLVQGAPSKVVFLPPRPSVFYAGEVTMVSVKVTDPVGNPKVGETVTLQAADPTIRVRDGTADTGDDGVARFYRLEVLGRPGNLVLNATAGEVTTGESERLTASLNVGPPRRLSVLVQPPSLTVTDSLFTRAPTVRVEDSAGNRLEKQEIEVTLCRLPNKNTRPDDDCNRGSADLSGVAIRRSDDQGTTRFDSLAIAGDTGSYFLMFRALDCAGQCAETRSNPVRYDPDLLLDRNFVEIGAIKSVAGSKPASEFFALRFKFRLSRKGIHKVGLGSTKVFALAYTDIALSNRESTDSVGSSSDRLDEAGISLNLQFKPHGSTWNQVPMRSFLIGGAFQVFRTVPYLGAQIGSIEHSGSPFQGSAVVVGVLRSLYETPVIVNDQTVRPSGWNAFAHFYIRSSGVDFFKHLSIRGSFLLPFLRGQTIQSRIAVIVPIETLKDF